MNISFIVLGLSMIIGSHLLYNQYKNTMATKVGFSLFSIGGFGTILVGLFPENSLALLHTSGAGLSFLVGNIGVLILGISLKLPKSR
jgi:hypothetical membrane protein